jgi:hypothetical protein
VRAAVTGWRSCPLPRGGPAPAHATAHGEREASAAVSVSPCPGGGRAKGEMKGSEGERRGVKGECPPLTLTAGSCCVCAMICAVTGAAWLSASALFMTTPARSQAMRVKQAFTCGGGAGGGGGDQGHGDGGAGTGARSAIACVRVSRAGAPSPRPPSSCGLPPTGTRGPTHSRTHALTHSPTRPPARPLTQAPGCSCTIRTHLLVHYKNAQ